MSSSRHSSSSHGLSKSDFPFQDVKYPFCPHLKDTYEKLAKIGQGRFGEVFKAKRKDNNQLVALKKVIMENETQGFPITALREIKVLQALKHKNLVHLVEICFEKVSSRHTEFNLVLEYCDHDLAGLLSNISVVFKEPEIKEVMKQLFEGLEFIHHNKIMHRDMKPNNILITKDGVLKLADFGLARACTSQQPNNYTKLVVTLWYRPPEILLGDRDYGPAIDLWSAGCIMAEMWSRKAIMQGTSEQKQLELITQLCGSINKEVWPKVEGLALFRSIKLPQGEKRKVKENLLYFTDDVLALDLLEQLLTLDPTQRCKASDALNHPFFYVDPQAKSLKHMLSLLRTSYARAPKSTQSSTSDQHFEQTY